MDAKNPSLALPQVIKRKDYAKPDQFQHPLVVACIRPKKTYMVQCDDCNITFAQKKLLLHHRISVHGEKPQWKCSECDMILSSKYILQAHMDTHSNQKKHKCPACPASFNTKTSVKRHYLYKHTEERPHQCSMCDFATVEHDKLMIHLRNHTGESPYQCDTCGMNFKTPIAYKRHMVVHSGVRQYLCTLCLKKFGTPVTVKQHMFTSHGIVRQMLTSIRNVREHGVPSMLATFLADMQIGDEETKMVNSLKYYEVQKDALDEVDIVKNVDWSVFNNSEKKVTVDKTAFFKLTNKCPVSFKKDETDLSDTDSPEAENTGKRKRKRQPVTRNRKSNETSGKLMDTVTDEFSVCVKEKEKDIKNVVPIIDETETAVTDNTEPVVKKHRDTSTRSGSLNQEEEAYVKEASQLAAEEVTEVSVLEHYDTNEVKTLIEQEKNIINEMNADSEFSGKETAAADLNSCSQLADAEVERHEISETRVLDMGKIKKTPMRSGETRNETILADELLSNNASVGEESVCSRNESSSLETPVFVNLNRKRFHIKTPRLSHNISGTKGNTPDGAAKGSTPDGAANKCENKANKQQAQYLTQTVQTPLPGECNQVETTAVVDKANDAADNEPGAGDIPYPTNFISVITESPSDTEEQSTNIQVSPLESSKSSDSGETIHSSTINSTTNKNLPPFIALKGLTPHHQERLLTGMKKGVFGPSPSVVRVLEDGSMINITSLYKSYLPSDYMVESE